MRSTSHHASATDCRSVTDRPSRNGIVYTAAIVSHNPPMTAIAGRNSSTDVAARLQNDSPRSTKSRMRAWMGTIHVNPATTHCTNCWSTKLHCWVCPAFVTSCIQGSGEGGRRGHCYKTDPSSQEIGGDGRHGTLATCGVRSEEHTSELQSRR